MAYNVLSKKRNDMKDEILQIAYNLEKGKINEDTAKKELCVLLCVIPREIPDKLYLEIEEKKCERYGGVLAKINKQAEYSNGQCDTIDTIEEWLKTL